MVALRLSPPEARGVAVYNALAALFFQFKGHPSLRMHEPASASHNAHCLGSPHQALL